MGRIYYKKLPLFHVYDSDLTGTQKLLMFLLGIDENLSVYELGYLALMRIDDVMFDLNELKRRGVSSRQMKTAKIFAAENKNFTLPRCSESSTGITEKCASARFCELSRGFAKPDMPTCGQDIMLQILSEFQDNRIFHRTAKPSHEKVHRLRCFHYLKSGGTT